MLKSYQLKANDSVLDLFSSACVNVFCSFVASIIKTFTHSVTIQQTILKNEEILAIISD